MRRGQHSTPNGVGPSGRTGSGYWIDRLPGVLLLKLYRAEIAESGVAPGSIVQRGLRTPTGQFFARFFIGIIPGLVAEFAFIVPSTRVVLSSSAARLMGRKQIGGLKYQHGCSTERHPLTPSFWQLSLLSASVHLRRSLLLDLALKDQTPSVAPLSGASRASHDQNRGETHVTPDD